MNRIDRLSAILIQLQSRTQLKAQQIADRFEISLRTVYRDIRALEEAGIPIVGNPGVGYSLIEGFKLPPLMFTHEEALSFLIAEKLVNELTDTDSSEHYRSGMEKIRSVMRFADKEVLEMVEENLSILKTYKSTLYKPDVLLLILQSIHKKRTLSIIYSNAPEREVEPVGLFFSKSNWYMVAFCLQKESYLIFRIDRLQEATLSEHPFTQKHPALNSFLDRFYDKGHLYEVVIRIGKEHSSMMGDDKYYYGLTEEKMIDNVIEYRFMTFSLEKFARWYLSYADVATIIEPSLLKETIKSIICKILL